MNIGREQTTSSFTDDDDDDDVVCGVEDVRKETTRSSSGQSTFYVLWSVLSCWRIAMADTMRYESACDKRTMGTRHKYTIRMNRIVEYRRVIYRMPDHYPAFSSTVMCGGVYCCPATRSIACLFGWENVIFASIVGLWFI